MMVMSTNESSASQFATVDPSTLAVAKVYAVAFINAAAKDQSVDAALEEFGSLLDDVLTPHPDFETLLCGTMTSLETKLAMIDKVIAPRATPLLVSTLKVLARHERLSLVRAVFLAAQLEQEHRTGRVRVQVTSAAPLSESELQGLRDRLSQTLSAEPILLTALDPELLGGLVIRVGDTVYDGSVRNRLKQLRGQLRQRCLNEVQRGRDRFSHSAGN
ncbi:ATP synthase F1 subunit delta [bacterium]|nr:ATP synthase F1 subunit delta [bacterium]